MQWFWGLPQDKSSTSFCRTLYLYLQPRFGFQHHGYNFPPEIQSAVTGRV